MNAYVFTTGIVATSITMLLLWLLTIKISAQSSIRWPRFGTLIFWLSSVIGGCISYSVVGKFALGLCFGMGVGALSLLLLTGALKQKWTIGSLSGLIVGLIALAFHDDVLVFALLLLSGILMGIAWQFFESEKNSTSLPSP